MAELVRSSFEMKPKHRKMLMELGEEMIKQGSDGFDFVVRDGECLALLQIDLRRRKNANV